MKLTAVFKFNLPFESWTAVLTPTTGGSTIDYVKSSDGMGAITQGGGGINLLTTEGLPVGSQVRNLRDAEGKEVFVENGESYAMFVHTAVPQFDPFSRIIGWRHMVKREEPKQLQTFLNNIAGSVL